MYSSENDVLSKWNVADVWHKLVNSINIAYLWLALFMWLATH